MFSSVTCYLVTNTFRTTLSFIYFSLKSTFSGAHIGSAEVRRKLKDTSYQKRPAVYSKHGGVSSPPQFPKHIWKWLVPSGVLSSFENIHAALAVFKGGPCKHFIFMGHN